MLDQRPAGAGGSRSLSLRRAAALLVDLWDGFERFVTAWLPPWRWGMPGLLKFYMLWGFGWGAGALASGVSGRLTVISGPELLELPWGRPVLAGWGAVALFMAVALVRRRTVAFHLFLAFHVLWVALELAYWRTLSGRLDALGSVASALIWAVLMGLYGWHNRDWFRRVAPTSVGRSSR